jgi:hypothetical protein
MRRASIFSEMKQTFIGSNYQEVAIIIQRFIIRVDRQGKAVWRGRKFMSV